MTKKDTPPLLRVFNEACSFHFCQRPLNDLVSLLYTSNNTDTNTHRIIQTLARNHSVDFCLLYLHLNVRNSVY